MIPQNGVPSLREDDQLAPSQDSHNKKSKENYQLYDFVRSNTTDYLGWEATILFYAALHCVNHFFVTLPISKHPTTHDEISRLVSRHLRHYAEDYHYSWYISRWARYFDFEITETMRDTCLRNYNAVKALIP